jgi:hypothetical protein
VATDLVSARFPGFDAGYESYYLRAAEPSGGRGVWIRYTVHRRPGHPATGSLWFTWFDAARPPTAAKMTLPEPEAGAGSWIRIGTAELGPGDARGSIEPDDLNDVGVGWDLAFSGAPLFEHLPRPWMYAAPLPRTKPVSLHPVARISGNIVLGDQVVSLDGWPGMLGHNWGSEHAERWIWLHGTGFGTDAGADEEDWLDVVLARIKVGRMTTPWSGFGALCLDGERLRLGGLSRTTTTRVEEHPTRLGFELTGHRLRIEGRVAAPAERFVGWVYADPDGGRHDVVHCSTADLELTVTRSGAPGRVLRASGVAAYELGVREHAAAAAGIPMQPHPDG